MENATIEYSLESLCVCWCVCVCACVFLPFNSKNRSRNMKLEYIVVYKNSSEEFVIELHRIKVKVTVGIQNFPHLPQNTNCQVLYFNSGTSYEPYIKHLCSFDTNIQNYECGHV